MKKTAVKILIFVSGLFVMQAIIGYMTMPMEIRHFYNYLKERVDVIYFCDSTMRYYPADDESGAPIIKLLKECNPEFSVETVDHPGYNLDIYYGYCRAIMRSEIKPKAVLIPISLYSLSVEWLRPGYDFKLEQTALQSDSIFNRIFYRSLAALKKTSTTMEQYMETNVYVGSTIAGKAKDFDNKSYEIYSEEKFRKKIAVRYMYMAGNDSIKIGSLEKIAAMGKDRGVKFVFFVQPLDIETCSKFYGPDFMKTVKRNIAFIKEKAQSGGGVFLDYSGLLGKDEFAWKEKMYVNEHLNYRGRKKLAEKISMDVNGILSGRSK